MAWRRFRVRAAPGPLAHALDLLHVHAEVMGVEERDDEFEVWIDGALPPDVAGLGDIVVDELPLTAAMFAHSGREHDAPVWITPDLCVRPPWVARPPGFSGLELVVPRGSAFGSGEHASTRAALTALHRGWPERAVECFVDVGTGSGILLLYAAQRRARRLVACDIDPIAAHAAAHLVPAAFVFAGSPNAIECGAEVVVANMTATELAREREAIVARWAGRGTLVLSGLRGAQQVAACQRAYRAAGVDVASTVLQVEDFAALTYSR